MSDDFIIDGMELVCKSDDYERMFELLDKLPLVEQELIKLRFGFYGKYYSLRETKEALRLKVATIESVRQYQFQILKKLRKEFYE